MKGGRAVADAAPSPTPVAGAEDSDDSYIRFVETTKTSLFSYAVAVTGSVHLARDVLQDAYIEVFKRWDGLRREQPDGTGLIRREYVFTIIQNKFRDHLRSSSKREAREDKWASEAQLSGQNGTGDDPLYEQMARELWAAVRELDPTQQSLIYLVYVDGLSITKAGERLGLATTTARRRHERALDSLRSTISGEG